MNDKHFFDTNILVYSFDRSSPIKQQKAKQLISGALTTQKGIISYQVIQEFINVATRKFKVPLSISECNKYLQQVLEPLCEVYSSIELYRLALEVMERWQYSFYDSLIIAAAIQANCVILYSEDLQHNQKIHNITIRNPFIAT